MVHLTCRQPVREYEVRDLRGLLIGKVIEPARVPAIGRGARTVLLIRDPRPLASTA